MKVTKKLVNEFRADFNEAMKALETKYGCSIEAGTIRYSTLEHNFRFKTSVEQPVRIVENFTITPLKFADRIRVGDSVIVEHKKARNQIFTVVKINRVRMKLENESGQLFNAPINMISKVKK